MALVVREGRYFNATNRGMQEGPGGRCRCTYDWYYQSAFSPADRAAIGRCVAMLLIEPP